MDIEVYTDRYQREHGHKPQGRRFWRFTLVSSSGTAKDHFLDLGEQMTYPQALAKAQEVARLRKAERIIVEP
jgi:orotate phosphoribosyltransferase